MMVSGGITKDNLTKNNVDSCYLCCLKVNNDSFLCVLCGR